jgi:cytochrome c biogenesis protein CcmG/thiol:disulfide interchange protein DsbE
MKKSILSALMVASIALCALLSATDAAVNEGKSAPEFSRSDINGKPLRLSDYRGKIVLLNFWATWCGPCREEMPRFSEWQQSLGPRGLAVIGISMDDDAADVKRFLTQRPVSYRIAMGDAALGETYGGVLGLPTSYLIDRHGKIVAQYQGENVLPKIELKLKALLGNGPGSDH